MSTGRRVLAFVLFTTAFVALAFASQQNAGYYAILLLQLSIIPFYDDIWKQLSQPIPRSERRPLFRRPQSRSGPKITYLLFVLALVMIFTLIQFFSSRRISSPWELNVLPDTEQLEVFRPWLAGAGWVTCTLGFLRNSVLAQAKEHADPSEAS